MGMFYFRTTFITALNEVRRRSRAHTSPDLLSRARYHGQLTREVPGDWRIANITPIYKKGRQEDPGNYRPVSLASVLGKIMERFILSALTGHVKGNQGIRPSQHGFMKGRSCLTNLISFCDPPSG